MPFHVADILYTSNYEINNAHLQRYINLQNVKKYKHPENEQVTIIFLRTIGSLTFFLCLFLKSINFKNIFQARFDIFRQGQV